MSDILKERASVIEFHKDKAARVYKYYDYQQGSSTQEPTPQSGVAAISDPVT